MGLEVPGVDPRGAGQAAGASMARMAHALRECLLASYADAGEAMVIQTVLEANGVPCRVGDLANVPSHLFGIGGAAGRSLGLWVLEADAERATSLLATLGAPESVDEEALAAEATAAAAPPAREAGAARRAPWRASAARPRWPLRAAFASLVVLVLLAAWRGCRG